MSEQEEKAAGTETQAPAEETAEKIRKIREKAEAKQNKVWNKAAKKEGKVLKKDRKAREKAEAKERKILEKEERTGKKRKPQKPRKEPPKRSILEETGNAVTHGVGALAGIVGTTLMLIRSDTGIQVLSSIVYGVCMILMFLMSCLYHAFKWGTTVKRLWRRFDYVSIYLLIGGTFTPLWLLFWGGDLGTILCIAQWVIIITGITLIGVFGPDKVRWIHMTLYIVLGWLGLVFLPKMLREMLPLFFFTLGGGLLYTLGIIPFALKKKGAHFIWHFFVLFGAAAHWVGIYLYLY